MTAISVLRTLAPPLLRPCRPAECQLRGGERGEKTIKILFINTLSPNKENSVEDESIRSRWHVLKKIKGARKERRKRN